MKYSTVLHCTWSTVEPSTRNTIKLYIPSYIYTYIYTYIPTHTYTYIYIYIDIYITEPHTI